MSVLAFLLANTDPVNLFALLGLAYTVERRTRAMMQRCPHQPDPIPEPEVDR